MIDVGRLNITVARHAVTIQSTRPVQLSKIFIGKSVQHTLTTIPLLFNVCAVAQSVAAVTACSRALGVQHTVAHHAAWHILLAVETVREHGWWLLFNDDKARLAPFMQQVQLFKRALFKQGDAFSLNSVLQVNLLELAKLSQHLTQLIDELFLGQRLSYLALKNHDDLVLWLKRQHSLPAQRLQNLIDADLQDLGRCALTFLPELTEHDLRQHLMQAEFSQYPTWHGQCYETSCLSRQHQQPLIHDILERYGNGLLSRLASRLLELAALPDVWQQHIAKLNDNTIMNYPASGIAQLQASRGLLIHSVAVKNDMITQYQIIAPTEWNFHPNGVAALSLHAKPKQQATQIINAIDACVEFSLTIED